MEKTLKVLAIKNGTVLDHLPYKSGHKIIKILNLEQHDNIMTMGSGLPSKSLGKKDIVKFENLELTPEQVNEVAILAPTAKINIIKNYQVIKKFEVEVPEIIYGIIRCPNPKCMTNYETIETQFHKIKNQKENKFKCHFCERIFNQTELHDYLA